MGRRTYIINSDMRLRLPLLAPVAAAIVLSGSLIAFDPELSPELVLLAKIKRKAAQDLSHVPSFTCLATFDRAERRDDTKPFTHVDTVRAETAYVDGQELYAWPGSKSFDGGTFAQIVGTGMAGSGEVLSPSPTRFARDARAVPDRGAAKNS